MKQKLLKARLGLYLVPNEYTFQRAMNQHFFKSFKLLFLIGIFLLSSSGFAQKVTIKNSSISLREIFREIRKQTGYDFIYPSDDIKLDQHIAISLDAAGLEDALKICLKNQGLAYEIINKTIRLKKQQPTQQAAVQQFVHGIVLDKHTKQPLVGVTIRDVVSDHSVQTNKFGKFTHTFSGKEITLTASFVGYRKQEIKTKKQDEIIILMEKEETALEDVVVTGIFERPTQSFTGAAKTISGEELRMVNPNSIFSALAALDPSFRIIPNNERGGDINQLPEIQIRGANSLPNLTGDFIDNPNSPLFILDGFQTTAQRIFDLDLNMINSVTILKDAAATAIYGSRGANGVVVFTTILPKAGKLQISINNNFQLTTPDLSVYNLLNAREKLDFEKRVGFFTAEQANRQYVLDQFYNQRARDIAAGADINWLKIPTQNGLSNNTSVYVQGGDQHVRYGVQVGSDFQQGVMKGQTRKNYSGQFDLSYQTEKLRFRNSVRIFQTNTEASPYGSFNTYALMNPYWRPYDEQGNVRETLDLGIPNPLVDATLNTFNKSATLGITNNFQARWTPISSFFIESSFGFNKQTGDNDVFLPGQHSTFINEIDINRKGSYDINSNKGVGYESNTTANFNKPMGKHLIFSTLGLNFASSTNNFYSFSAVGFPFDQLESLLFANQYKPDSKPGGNESTVRRLGILANLNYAYDNRYMADLSVRRDGASQYGSAKRYGNFWSTGLGWNIHNEALLKNNTTLNLLRLRATYGSTGSLNVSPYRAQNRFAFDIDNMYEDQLGVVMMGLGNKNLAWQDVRTLNLGLNSTLFNRIDIGFEHYRSLTKNTITNVSLAPSTGFSNYSENLGTVENVGYELNFRLKLINNMEKGVIWSINASGATNKNILKKLSNKLKFSNNEQKFASTFILEEGQAINTLFVVPSLGVDPIVGREVFLKKDGSTTYTWHPEDKIPIGVSDPKWSGNFGTNLSYKGLQFNVIFSYRSGATLYNGTLVDKVQGANTYYNVDRRAYDLGWTKPGDESMFTKFGITPVQTNFSSRFVQKEHLLTMNSLSLGYNFFKSNFVKRIGFKNLSASMVTNDLFTFSSIAIERGTGNPFARSYTFSIRGNF